jgi:hypothetical protein
MSPELTILRFLKSNLQIRFVYPVHFKMLLEMDDATIEKTLAELVAVGIIETFRHPLHGTVYINPFSEPTVYECAMHIIPASYVSLETALSNYGVLSQCTFAYTLVTTYEDLEVMVYNQLIEYNKIPHFMFWGYEKDKDGVKVAEPEKAFVDWLYVRGLRQKWPFERICSMMDDMYLTDDDFSLEKVREYIREIEDKELSSRLLKLFEGALEDVFEKNKNNPLSKIL